jgi:hypothetical protein
MMMMMSDDDIMVLMMNYLINENRAPPNVTLKWYKFYVNKSLQ